MFDEETILFIGQLPLEFDGNVETYNNIELSCPTNGQPIAL